MNHVHARVFSECLCVWCVSTLLTASMGANGGREIWVMRDLWQLYKQTARWTDNTECHRQTEQTDRQIQREREREHCAVSVGRFYQRAIRGGNKMLVETHMKYTFFRLVYLWLLFVLLKYTHHHHLLISICLLCLPCCVISLVFLCVHVCGFSHFPRVSDRSSKRPRPTILFLQIGFFA